MMLLPHLVTAVMVVGSLLLSLVAAGSSSPEFSEAVFSGSSGSSGLSGASPSSACQIPGKGNPSTDDTNPLGIGKVPSHAEPMRNRDEIINVFRQGLQADHGIWLEGRDPKDLLRDPPVIADLGVSGNDSCNGFGGAIDISDDGSITRKSFVAAMLPCTDGINDAFNSVFLGKAPVMLFYSSNKPGTYWLGTSTKAIRLTAK